MGHIRYFQPAYMPPPNKSSPFARSLRLAVALSVILMAVFSVYVYSEKWIDQVNEQRFQSRLLAEELRQSSDNLTRMARTFVLTGDPIYKQHYLDILDIREGRKSRPVNYDGIYYWDQVMLEPKTAPPDGARKEALLASLKQAGFTPDEFRQLAQAKADSDRLAALELAAMALIEPAGPDLEARRSRAIQMLHDPDYHRFKADIMRPIKDVLMRADERTLRVVRDAKNNATVLRLVFVLVGLGLLASLWRNYRALRLTLGGSVDQVHAQIARIGQGDFTEAIAVAPAMMNSVLGWLAQTQRQLKEIEQARQMSDAKAKRLAQLYAALSDCNQAIVRCTNELQLFEQICRATVEHGGMKTAWIGLVDPQRRVIEPAVSCGVDLECLQHIHITVNPSDAQGRGPTGTAVREDQPFWCQDYQSDPITAPWHALGMRQGWAASAALPLHRNGVVIGAFNVYAGEKDAFDAQTRSLLVEMAADIDFALANFEREAAQLHNQQRDALRSVMLERLTSDLPLTQILADFARALEDAMPDALCAILLLDEQRQHPGLAACWSEPIRSGANQVLGTLVIYRRTPVLPQTHEIELIEMAAHLSALAIERKHAEVELHLKARVFEQGNEAIVITDAGRHIVRVNGAFSRITGYSEAEALGRNPSLLSSGRHAPDFYQSMWESIRVHGHWQGEIWNRRKDGSHYPEWLSISVLRDRNGAVMNYVGIAADISQSKKDEAQIRLLVDFDPLTGLPNRRLLRDRIDTALSHAQREGEPLALMFLDLDRFKNVNDSLGHHTGDELLVQVAQRLKAVLREQDTVCRVGGDEFVLLCTGTDASGAAHVAAKLLEATSQRYLIDQQELGLTCSIGIALYPQDGDSFEALSMCADIAMYRAKQAGRNAFCFFTAQMQAESARTLQLENGLRRALELQQLHLVYQPQVSLQDGRIVGMEALLRWQHPALGRVSPAEFIPVAEESGLILPIGEWVLRTATRQLRAWLDAGLPPLQLSVNLSAVQFRHANLPDLVSQVLAEAALAPQCLELELTEGVAMNDPLGAIAVMDNLHQRGVRMSIDDFGTGYSSLSYLKRFSVYKLKIDQSFVRDITDDPDDRAIVVAVIALARSLGFQTLAEGVETQGQLDFLRAQGCDEVQGYFFSVPLPADAFEAFVRGHQAS